ncbi:hypothetical protein [Kutzneria sp. CA-103260]|uniref:hypothetical protein n=1 Tax=Kutzneria sp. CA-103260 TaxID=2802641 RepID=UPI001BA652E9|nr:hypothetical protein [Kutzneria sp. CA-103260]QUQ63951.1 hypothetical protein JJ691_16680 [Kutzneria sp. CA-103260]
MSDRALRGRWVASATVLAVLSLLGAACGQPADIALPHNGSAPPTQQTTLSDAQIAAWQTAIQNYRQQAQAQKVPHAALQACFLLTAAQVDADLSHPAQPWWIVGTLAASLPAADPNSARCLLTTPAHDLSAGTSGGDTGAYIALHTGPGVGLDTATPHLSTPLPGTHWTLDYSAWHRRVPTAAELAWVVRDLVANLATPRPPSAYLPTS